MQWLGGTVAGTASAGMANVFLQGEGACGYRKIVLHLRAIEISRDGLHWESIPMSPHARHVDLLDAYTEGKSFLGQTRLPFGHYRFLKWSLPEPITDHDASHAVYLSGMQEASPIALCEHTKREGLLQIDFLVSPKQFSNLVLRVDVCRSVILHEPSADLPMQVCWDGFSTADRFLKFADPH